ncbi:BTE_HP_G0020450.mRNA.1.CDS.1 [Saccharomyces cerevisiae]|nr:BTE_HP_G0020450.mRNA.1.CDS.1 [Saccharomyces cerevisiae]CAI6602373.1 BTE_HP_G0020450.mRNA.1.CDS.1 [Saccharomyces cerevisiae]
MIERHPDNITAAMMGGFAGGKDVRFHWLRCFQNLLVVKIPVWFPITSTDISEHVKYQWNPAIKCMAIIPQFKLSTADSKGVLPKAYPTQDLVSI